MNRVTTVTLLVIGAALGGQYQPALINGLLVSLGGVLLLTFLHEYFGRQPSS